MRIKITPYRTFGKKTIKTIVNNWDLTLINVFGFGLWVLRSDRAIAAWSEYNQCAKDIRR